MSQDLENLSHETCCMVLHRSLEMLCEIYTKQIETSKKNDVPESRGNSSIASSYTTMNRLLPSLVNLLDQAVLQGEFSHAAVEASSQILSTKPGDPDAVEPFEITKARYKYPPTSPLYPIIMNDMKEHGLDLLTEGESLFTLENHNAERKEKGFHERITTGTSSFAHDFIKQLVDR
ncbi:hemagglutinin [Perkinsela sp. CCAP 1560/4]|nr:hemagglutinin [Perkinsela sp. CCAP 1560/4]|eukprot:KNH09728.1 hemagglutinin [Perkinsela sp. CCAP 1560/4]